MCYLGKRGFADMIKVMDHEMGRLNNIIWARSFVDHDSCSTSSKVFLPTVVVIMVILVKFT